MSKAKTYRPFTTFRPQFNRINKVTPKEFKTPENDIRIAEFTVTLLGQLGDLEMKLQETFDLLGAPVSVKFEIDREALENEGYYKEYIKSVSNIIKKREEIASSTQYISGQGKESNPQIE